MMRALTLWQPWAWAVAAGYKPVENRPWAPPANMIGVPFAIHAGKRWDWKGEDAIGAARVALPASDPLIEARGAVIGIATVERVVRSNATPGFDNAHPGTLTDEQRLWYFGPYGWLLRDVVRLSEPIPCRGSQLFWTLPMDVEAEVLRQVGRLRRIEGVP
jgi:hypothetical protein